MQRLTVVLLMIFCATAAWGGEIYTSTGGTWFTDPAIYTGTWNPPFLDHNGRWGPGTSSSQTSGGGLTAPTNDLYGDTAHLLSGTLNTSGGQPLTAIDKLIIDSGAAVVVQGGGGHRLQIDTALTSSGNLHMEAGATLYMGTTGSTDAVTASGGGTITLDAQAPGVGPATLDGFGHTLYLLEQTIQGGGTIASVPNLSVGSGSLIDANQTGATFLLDNDTINSLGVVQASNGGTLEFYSHAYLTGGTLQAIGASTLVLNDGSFSGGTLSTDSGSLIAVSSVQNYGSGHWYDNFNINDATINGNFQVATGKAVGMYGTITNPGTLDIQGEMDAFGDLTLKGGGTVALGGGTMKGTLNAVAALNNQSQTIQGSGLIIGFNVLTNEAGGVIDANLSGQTLLLQSNTIVNNGMMQASGGGTLQFSANGLSGGGTIRAQGAGSTVLLSGGSFNGNTFTTSGGGQIVASGQQSIGGGGYYDTLTIGDSTIDGDFQVQASHVAGMQGTINNTGTLTLQTGAELDAIGAFTLSGGGTITLAGATLNGTLNTAHALNNQSQTIQGSGTITSFSTLTNGTGGVIDANLSGQTLQVESSTIVNNGVFQAANGGTLQFVGDGITGSGTIHAAGGSTVYLDNGSFSGGTLSTTGSGQIVDRGTMLCGMSGCWYTTSISDVTVQVGQGGTVILKDLTNYSGGTLTGGTYDVAGHLDLPGAVTKNSATIILDGASASITAAGGGDALAGFNNNLADGSFTIQNGHNFTTSGGDFANAGLVNIGVGGTFTANNYNQTGGTAVTVVNGELIANLHVTGGELEGSGSVHGNLEVGGTLSPGNSPGTLTVTGDLTLDPAAVLNMEIASTSSYDKIIVGGDLSLDGTLNLIALAGYTPHTGDAFEVLKWGGALSGAFDSINLPTLAGGYYFETLWDYNNKDLTFAVAGGGSTAAPEPGTTALVGAGILLLAGIWKRRTR